VVDQLRLRGVDNRLELPEFGDVAAPVEALVEMASICFPDLMSSPHKFGDEVGADCSP
jgi:hypothetical protein